MQVRKTQFYFQFCFPIIVQFPWPRHEDVILLGYNMNNYVAIINVVHITRSKVEEDQERPSISQFSLRRHLKAHFSNSKDITAVWLQYFQSLLSL